MTGKAPKKRESESVKPLNTKGENMAVKAAFRDLMSKDTSRIAYDLTTDQLAEL